ncbi:hypothetical protein V1260_10755 [Brachybacterium sp. J144]|uniref:PH-like domain-containing protein n=1 Tax=Brachybacterium sp. J144 TaxID=3116487 RepID=UPI002E777FCA|nr:hypothetical protein [Brachybacterium sp. J144]MEE1651266.1 hypothetical protein [Brachybacterium sp. J144]
MDRLVPVLLLVLVFLLLLGLMVIGWRGRRRSQQHLPAPDSRDLAALGEQRAAGPFDGVYVDTVLAEQPLERVVAHGLGQRATASVEVGEQGTWHIRRQGLAPLTVPSSALAEITTSPGMAGKFVGGDGLLVLRWRLGDQLLDTGLRLARRADHDLLLSRKEHA